MKSEVSSLTSAMKSKVICALPGDNGTDEMIFSSVLPKLLSSYTALLSAS